MILRKRPVIRATTRLVASLSTGLLPLLYTTASYAIVIQPVQVKSALGEPFYAEIAISDLGNVNLKDISVDVANPQVLADFGIAAGSYNQPLSMNVQAVSNDRGVIVIRSRQPINDPFVEFVVQVKAGQNTRLQRVNAMVDPPVTKKKVVNLSPATVTTAPTVNLPVSSMPTLAASSQETSTANPGKTTFNRTEQNLNVIKAAPPDMNPMAGADISTAKNANKNELAAKEVEVSTSNATKPKHMVQNNESLWKIAKQLEPKLQQPVGQIMQRIRDLNHDAFIAGDPNQLKRGAVLVLPENDQKAALVTAPATPLPTKPAAKPATAMPYPQIARSGLLPKAELTLVAPTGQGSAQGNANSSKNSQSPSLPREMVLKIGQERRKTVLLQHEVSELDAQLTLNDKKIAMLNAKLAELEHQLKSRNQAKRSQATASQPQQQIAPKEPIQTPSSKTLAPTHMTPTPMIPQNLVPEKTVPQKSAPKVAANAFLPVVAFAALAMFGATPNLAHAAEDDGSGFPLWMIGVAVLVIVAVVAKVISSKNSNKKPARGKPKRPANRPAAKKEQPNAKPAQPVPVARPIAQPAQTDVLQEVQNYIERERYSQAQGLLKNAIGKNPQRTDLQVKLLEVLALQNDVKGFESQFDVVQGLNQPELTEHAEKMRVLLHPEPEELSEDLSFEFTPSNLDKAKPSNSNEIDFQPSQPPLAAEVEVPSSVADQSLAELEAEFGFSSEPAAARTETALDFDLNQQQTQVQPSSNQVDFSPATTDSHLAADEPMLDLDFDLKDSFTLEEVKVPAQAPTTFELDNPPASAAEIPAKVPANLDQLNVADTNWADGFADQEFNVGTDTTSTHAASVAVSPTIPANLDNNAEDFLSKEFPFLVNLDVQQTNLELAESYLNLGERSSARELLGEVMSQGNPQQQAQAQHLMQKLVS